MVRVKDIYDHFHKKLLKGVISSPLEDYLKTVPGYESTDGEGIERIDMSLAMSVVRICDKMVEDVLLMKTKTSAIPFLNEYLCVSEVHSSDPNEFIRDLDYGTYDFKYKGLSHIYESFRDSVVPIPCIKADEKEDLGTAYYIGNGRFVTAAHCVRNLKGFNVLLHDGTRLPITKVSFAKDQDLSKYDLAVLFTNAQIPYRSLWLEEPMVLDDVLTMGYPSVPCFNLVEVAEKASVGVIVRGGQKSAVGQVVAPGESYMSPLDYFLINARVKGGNSGGPVINGEGKVIGTIVEIPFDSQGGSDTGRYDIMGFGVCLPSKYVTQLLANQDEKVPVDERGYYRIP